MRLFEDLDDEEETMDGVGRENIDVAVTEDDQSHVWGGFSSIFEDALVMSDSFPLFVGL